MRTNGILLAAFALAACGSNERSAEGEDGASVDATAGADNGANVNGDAGTGMAANLPDGFDVYPGASVVTATNITSPDGGGAVVVMTASASPQDLVDFYRAQAEAAGVTISTEARAGGNLIIAGEGPGGLTFSFNASDNGGTTKGQLVVGRGLQ